MKLAERKRAMGNQGDEEGVSKNRQTQEWGGREAERERETVRD